METATQQAMRAPSHGFSSETVWVIVIVGLVAALAILWLVDWLGRGS